MILHFQEKKDHLGWIDWAGWEVQTGGENYEIQFYLFILGINVDFSFPGEERPLRLDRLGRVVQTGGE